MPELCIIIFVILSIVGLVSIVRKIIMWLLKHDDGEIIIIIPVEGHCEDIEYRIRCAYERVSWSVNKSRIVCLDKGMDKETYDICHRVCDRFGIELISSPSLSKT